MKYSVLMSVYYKEKPDWLKISIQSMLNQTIKPEEFLIVKDGPLTQELEETLSSFIKIYPDVFSVISLSENRGLGPALAIGVENCRNEIIIRMDSDDYSVPSRCEKLLLALKEKPECGIIGSYEVEFENKIENIVAVHKVPERPEEIKNFMRRRCALLHPTVLYKKSVILKCGNYNDVHLFEDYDLFMRAVIEYNIECYNIPENLYYIRVNNAFFERRGGINYLIKSVSFKCQQYKKKNIGLIDFIISAGGQALVCIMPNIIRKKIYTSFLRN